MIKEFIEGASLIPGVPGYEMQATAYIAEAFERYADDVRVDGMQNVIARVGTQGPRIMLLAHLDEIGMVVMKIEKDGCLRITENGGVDPRILPSHEVYVQTKSGPLYGVIGAKPPHVQTPDEQKKPIKFEDLYIDVGYSYDEVVKRVRVGDMVTMKGGLVSLTDEIMANKTMDDRACVAVMLKCAELLKRQNARAQTLFVSTAQEEIGGYGATTSAHALDPDIAIAIDVTHAETPDSDKFGTYPLDKVVITAGPTIHPALFTRLKKTADENRISYEVEIANGRTWTDADDTQTARGGIPTLLISVPCRYMHTSVETISLTTVSEAARLLAHFISDISSEWEDFVWY